MTEVATWSQILAAAINVVGTLLAVKGAAWLVPYLRARVPMLLPILAGAVGPALAVIQTYLSTALGVPIDLSPLLAVFTGSSSIALAQVFIQRTRMQGAQTTIMGLSRAGAPI